MFLELKPLIDGISEIRSDSPEEGE